MRVGRSSRRNGALAEAILRGSVQQGLDFHTAWMAAFHPTEPIPTGMANGGCGASGSLPRPISPLYGGNLIITPVSGAGWRQVVLAGWVTAAMI